MQELLKAINYLNMQHKKELGCVCQECGKRYNIDLLIPDHLWNFIRPIEKTDGGGLLCGSCIMLNLESISNLTGRFFTIKADLI